ncbi:XRE family transcriptional regulator [Salinicola aestuarinus]|uniref:XRE family transcriptional regulator n=1 Tax=Salinicola aestuarinus TaxID=1949082 RepID=UPI001CB6FAB2|nr:S24 family peptidase [Salinicola aestuarinus]
MQDPEAFKARIREALKIAKSRGVTQASIAERAGVSAQAVGQWSRSGKISNQRLAVLAQVSGKTLDWFYAEQEKEALPDAVREPSASYGHPASENELTFTDAADPWDHSKPVGEDEVEIPLFREVSLSGGGGRTQVIENNGASLRFKRSTLRSAGVGKDSAACAFVDGESMEPILPDGATVGVDTADKQVKDGKMYAIDHDGLLRVKFLYRLPGGGLRIRSANPDKVEHPDEDLGEDWPEAVRIIGKVFWYSVLLH